MPRPPADPPAATAAPLRVDHIETPLRVDPSETPLRVDALQYANWSEKVFRQMRAGGLDGVHVTITYHETFRETVANISAWHRRFERHCDLIFQGEGAADLIRARATGRTAIFFGAQNPSCIEDDIGLVEVLYRLGLRFMQLSYNNQSLLAAGCYETEDSGLTRMGRAVVAEMNRLGMIVDMSHSGERSTLGAIAQSTRPIAITHANPAGWHPVPRNKSDRVLRALGESGGMLGFSLYPHHLRGGSGCSLQAFCDMVARTADLMGPAQLGIGSDLCQDQPDSVVAWMRNGRWTRPPEPDRNDPGKGAAVFPSMPDWFQDNRDFGRLAQGLAATGLDAAEIAGIMGGNWARFLAAGLGPVADGGPAAAGGPATDDGPAPKAEAPP